MTAALDRVIGRLRGGARDRRYGTFVDRLEPELLSRPRVHRFATLPLLGDDTTPAVPLAVCIDPSADGDAAVTRASIERQSVAPAEIAERSASDALRDPGATHVAIVAAGDVLSPLALERLGQAFTLAPGAAMVTCDDDELDGSGRRVAPRCGPGPSPDLLLECARPGALLVVAREAAKRAGVQPGPAWAHELALRLTGPDGAGAAHVPQLLCHRQAAPQQAPAGAVAQAVIRVLGAWGEGAARVEAAGERGRLRIRRPLRGEPAVEAIVCTRDHPQMLERCARSLLSVTSYERLRLRIVDNGGVDPAGAQLLRRLGTDPRVTVDRDDRPFNFAALNHAAVQRADAGADVLAFVNDDVAFADPGWLEALLEHAQRAEVGAVAPLLLYPDGGTVQHAGAAIGLHGWAGHPFAGLGPDTATPLGTAADGARNWLAVSAACLVVERAKYAAVGGFDASFAVGGNDVDLCLRLTAAGHRSLCVPHAVGSHDESATRDPRSVPLSDHGASRRSYGDFRTVGDPFYNSNLTLARTDCGMREPGEPEPPE